MNNIYRLSNLEIEKWKKKSDQFIIIPIGSLEQHGDHLPVSTDSIIIEHLAKKVSEKIQSLYLPAITFGISFEHEPLFNISLSHQTYSNFISEICVSLVKYGMKNIILLNGHHGNMGCLYYISQNVSDKIHSNAKINFINYWNLMKDFDHAGEIETSLVLAINTKLVKMKMAKANTKELAGSRIAYTSLTTRTGSFPRITGNGVWGDPTKASIIKGRSLLENLTQKIVEIIKEFKNFN
ncbi:MAG TPA: creatininase family protein [Nitrososphaeraceae archaeon]|jgi:creatinine amidohydrolase|nr:creatininase family protein [Nitrososphaeraceae archaeon]